MQEFPIVGDTALPWFDPDWPWNGPRLQRFIDYGFYRGATQANHVDVDFQFVTPVAMFAGADGDCWDECVNQQILILNEKRWQILSRAPTRSELLKRFDTDEVDYVWTNHRPYPTVFEIGAEGLTQKVAITQWGGDDSERVIRFDGDQAVRQVVDTLAGWGVVSSRYWPTLLTQFPQFQQCEKYLAELGVLWSDSPHPLHQSGMSPKQVAPTPGIAAELSDYQKLWKYAKKNWLPVSGNFRIAESIKDGPGNYQDCIDKLLPPTHKMGRTRQTKFFHSVKGALNPILREEFGFEVFRDNEEVVIRNWVKPLSTKKKITKKSTKRKS